MAACGSFAGDAGETSSAGVFVEFTRVELEESARDPIVSIEHVGARPGGGFVIPDRHAGKVRLFDATGRIDRTLGEPGDGPGELNEPAGAVELPDGRVIVVQRADPRLTVYRPDADPVVRSVPGQYGFWAAPTRDGLVAGVATRETRFASFDDQGTPRSVFGTRDPAVAETPFWIFFAADHAAVVGDLVAVSTSFFPTIRLFRTDGTPAGVIGEPPDTWMPPTEPPVEDLSRPENRERLEAWARSFTIVRSLATVADSLLVVEYGRHEPQERDPYFTVPTTVDVYDLQGAKLAEGVELPGPVVGGGSRLLVLASEPPDAWSIAAFEWGGGT